MSIKKANKLIAVLLVSSMLSLVVAACGNSAKDSNSGKGKDVSLRVATSFAGSDPWVTPWAEAVKQFELLHPGVKIVDESTPVNQEALRTKIKADAATSNLADVMFYFNGSETKVLAESNQIVSWEDELQKDATWASNFNSAILEKVKYEGKQYSLPYIGFYEGLFYNKKLFDQYNLAPPTTYDALLKAVTTFAMNDIVPITTSLTTPYIQEAMILSLVGPEGQAKAYDPSWAPAINLIKDLSDLKAFPKDALTLDDDKAQTLFANGKAAMMFNGSWAAAGLSKVDGIEITPFPLVPGGVAENVIISGFGSGWYMKKNDDNQAKHDMALEFVKYMTSPKVAGTFAVIGGSYAVNTEAGTNMPHLLQAGNTMVSQAKDFVMPIDSYVSRESYEAFLKGISYVTAGKKTAEQILEEAKVINDKNK
ncbi:ABC transporter substrate-binding protein [Paenibacillus sp. CMAA1364]